MKKKTILFICTLLILLIWLNSCVQGTLSNDLSAHVTSWVYDTFHLEGDFLTLHVFIRKSAHFIEYTLLGIFISWLYFYIKQKKSFIVPFLFSFLIACLDELIQYYTPMRNGQFKDVLLDMSGALFGISLFYIIKKIQQRIKK